MLRPELLTFLETPEARRLAAAWPDLHFADKAPRNANTSAAIDAGDWCRVAGLASISSDAIAVVNALRGLGICRDDGTLDPTAADFIARAAWCAATGERGGGGGSGGRDLLEIGRLSVELESAKKWIREATPVMDSMVQDAAAIEAADRLNAALDCLDRDGCAKLEDFAAIAAARAVYVEARRKVYGIGKARRSP